MLIGLSHDADSIKKPLRHVLKVRKRFSRRQLIAHVLGLKNLYDNFRDIMAFEDDLGVRSTFFIPVVLFDVCEIEDTLRELLEGGWEVGLHFVVEGAQRAALVRMEKEWLEELLGRELEGVRSHGLVIDEDLMSDYARAGFTYDSSYRMEQVGRSTPFPHPSGLVEVPVGVMDADLFGRLHLSEEKALRYVLRKVEKASARGEEAFVLLFHQESFSMKGGRIYRRLVETLLEENKAFKLSDLIRELGLVVGEEGAGHGGGRGRRRQLHQGAQGRR